MKDTKSSKNKKWEEHFKEASFWLSSLVKQRRAGWRFGWWPWRRWSRQNSEHAPDRWTCGGRRCLLERLWTGGGGGGGGGGEREREREREREKERKREVERGRDIQIVSYLCMQARSQEERDSEVHQLTTACIKRIRISPGSRMNDSHVRNRMILIWVNHDSISLEKAKTKKCNPFIHGQ